MAPFCWKGWWQKMPLSILPSFLVYCYVGAITPGPAVADEDPGAGTPELVDKINELLASLRTAGVIAT